MYNLINNLEAIIDKISLAAAKSGRSAQDIQIVAASKNRPIELLSELYGSGKITAFGENKAQELVAKYDEQYSWDFIGRLQTNKAKYLVGKVRLIQSVDRDKLAAEIDRLAKKDGLVQDILIEINSGNEEAKGGLCAQDAPSFARSLAAYPNLALRGVMAVAPIGIDKPTLTKLFLQVKDAYEIIKSDIAPDIDTLSMGMSGDYETAIECGANLIRLGRVLFDGEKY